MNFDSKALKNKVMVLENNFLMMQHNVFQLELRCHVIYVNDLTLLLNVLMVKSQIVDFICNHSSGHN
jgi:hypothetical protein